MPIPILSRRTELALLYAALASDLATWKRLNPTVAETTGAPLDLPVVWRLHHVAARHRDLLDNPAADFTDPANEMNEELRRNQVRLGGTHRLEPEQVGLLMKLMLDSTNAQIAPYEPPPATSGW